MPEYFNAILSDTPIVYYRMDELSGTVAIDQSGNAYDGTYAGVSAYNQTGAIADDPDPSLQFIGNTGIVSTPTSVIPTNWSKYTLEFWIKISGGWHHVTVTCDNTTTVKYLDGVVSSGGTGDRIVIDQNLLYAGTASNGYIDEVALYNSVFTAAQVAWHYSVGITGRMGIYKLLTTYRRTGEFIATYRRGV